MRIYDPRLGKFLSVDPLTKKYPELTPYQFSSNTPIWATDLDGLESNVTTSSPPGLGVSSLPAPSYPGPGLQAYTNGLAPSPYQRVADFQNGGRAEDFWPDGTYKNNLLDIFGNGYLRTRKFLQFHAASGPTYIGIPGISYSNSAPSYWGKVFAKIEFENQFKSRGTDLITKPEDFKKEQSNSEYFYRAMSLGEFYNTGGSLETRGGKDSYPFVTPNLGYLTNKNSFIWQQTGKYDIILKYTVQAGTKTYLNTEGISVAHGSPDAQTAWLTNQVIRKSESYTTLGGIRLPNTNYGFPGISAKLHFNPKIVKREVIFMNIPGVKED